MDALKAEFALLVAQARRGEAFYVSSDVLAAKSAGRRPENLHFGGSLAAQLKTSPGARHSPLRHLCILVLALLQFGKNPS